MKKFFTIIAALVLPLMALAQESQEEFLRRYNNLVGRVGASGVGVETLLNKWEAAYPEDPQQLLARFSFCFDRSRESHVIQLDRDRYLGREPLIPYTDSLGNRKNFFEDFVYDDDLYAQANLAIDRAIALRPSRLDYRLVKIDAMMAYEKEQPEMALQNLKSLADKNFKEHPAWQYEGLEDTVTDEQFLAFMQDYAVALFRIGSDASQEAFRAFSEYMLKYCKDDPLFTDNLGSYYLVKKDYKKAAKYFDQVLKKHPSDMTAIQNGIILARAKKDLKLEKKYLAHMARYGEKETDRQSAQMRLDAMGKR